MLGALGYMLPCTHIHMELSAAAIRRRRGSLMLSMSMCGRAHVCSQEQKRACQHQWTQGAESHVEWVKGIGDRASTSCPQWGTWERAQALITHGSHRSQLLHGHWPPWCLPWKHVAGGAAVLFIYLLRPIR